MILINTLYNDLKSDKYFGESSKQLGQNLLLPNKELKKRLNAENIEIHTMDMFSVSEALEADVLLFNDIPIDSWLSVKTLTDRMKYVLKRKWRRDYFYYAVKCGMRNKMILNICEPPSVHPLSHEKRMHKYFSRILTWNDTYVEETPKLYHKLAIPQIPSNNDIFTNVPRNGYVLMASNKSSNHPNELYSLRRQFISYFENRSLKFDLYGAGWKNLKNYKGICDNKLSTMRMYKFCICPENIYGEKGYITEKIFDALFAGCIPIYKGASNIKEYIPSDIFINVDDFVKIDDIISFCECMPEEEYQKRQDRIAHFLQSKQFVDNFSVERYTSCLIKEVKEICTQKQG